MCCHLTMLFGVFKQLQALLLSKVFSSVSKRSEEGPGNAEPGALRREGRGGREAQHLKEHQRGGGEMRRMLIEHKRLLPCRLQYPCIGRLVMQDLINRLHLPTARLGEHREDIVHKRVPLLVV